MAHAKIMLIFLVIIPGFLISDSTEENILFCHPISTYSHRISVWPLVKKLVEKGHQITFISPYPNKTPLENVTEIIPEPSSSFVLQYIHGDLDISKRVDGTMDRMQDNGPIAATITSQLFFESPDVQKWLASNPKYDLVVVDWFFSEFSLGLAYKFKAKTIFYAASVMIPGFYELFGVVPDTASVPEFEYHFSTDMTFWERIINTLQPLVWRYKTTPYLTEITDLLRKKLDVPDMPNVRELAKNVSLILWSDEAIDGYPVPITPNFVRVGGMHCQESANPLPKNLEEFVGQSEQGFIYISLGSGVNPNNLPKHYQDIFFNTIKKFSKIQFIWKWSERTETNTLKNLHIGQWFPQQDILGHPKLLAFVTQAGKPSIQESVCHGAPVLAMPVFADQDVNAERIQSLGAAVVVDIATLTEQSFQSAIHEITTNKKYKERMSHYSKLFHDRPMKPADTALWWTEYALRHENVHHLRSMSINKSWYERRLLDVWAAIAVAVLFGIALFIFIIKLSLQLCLGQNQKVKSH